MVIAIIDEEKKDVKTVLTLLEEFLQDFNIDITVYDSSYAYLKKNNADIIIMEAYLQGMTGIELKDYLYSIRKESKVLFISRYNDNIEKAFGKNVYGYLKKPINKKEFFSVMNKILSESIDDRKIKFKNNGIVYEMKLRNVVYIEAQDKYTLVVTNVGKHLIRKSLKKWESELEGCNFYRIHKSYLVNCIHIKRINSMIEMDNGRRLPYGITCKQLKNLFSNRMCR